MVLYNSGISKNLKMLNRCGRSKLTDMLRRHCCTWDCHNKKRWCREDAGSNQHCECKWNIAWSMILLHDRLPATECNFNIARQGPRRESGNFIVWFAMCCKGPRIAKMFFQEADTLLVIQKASCNVAILSCWCHHTGRCYMPIMSHILSVESYQEICPGITFNLPIKTHPLTQALVAI